MSSSLIRYKPSHVFDSSERLIRMVVTPVDLLEPPKFKHKRIPKAYNGSPPVTVMHSPPRPPTFKDQQDWKIPPCISNWKNPKGYTIPLEKRLATDNNSLQINDNFAKLSEAMCVAEHKARQAVAMRSRVQKEMAIKEKQQKEIELRDLARKARDECCFRERKKKKRERTLPVVVSKKLKRDDRDITEKLALGMATTTGKLGEFQYDQRLFNQEKGMDSGFAATDDAYNIYDKGLFTAQPTISTLYRPNNHNNNKDAAADSDMYGGADEQMDKIDRFKPHKAFTASSSETPPPRKQPNMEKKLTEEVDPFGLDLFLTEIKKGKIALDQIGSSGTMKATAGSMLGDGYQGFQQTAYCF